MLASLTLYLLRLMILVLHQNKNVLSPPGLGLGTMIFAQSGPGIRKGGPRSWEGLSQGWQNKEFLQESEKYQKKKEG